MVSPVTVSQWAMKVDTTLPAHYRVHISLGILYARAPRTVIG